jgi:hypothetical protein
MRKLFVARRCLLLLAALVVSVDAEAQDVTVTMMDGSSVSAALHRLTDAEIVLRGKLEPYPRTDVVPGTEKVIPLTSVRTIERRGHGVRNGVLIGIAAGVAMSLVVTEMDDSTEDAPMAGLAILSGIGAGVGLGIGAIFDATGRDGRLLYSAPPAGTVRFRPIATPKRQGLRLTLTW